MLNPMAIGRFLSSGSGQKLYQTVTRLGSQQGIPLEQGVEDLIGFIEELEKASNNSGKSVKEVADISIALFRQQYHA